MATPSPTPTPLVPVPSVTSTPFPADSSTVVLNPSWNEVFDFIASLVGSLIWPAVVVFLILWFRSSIRPILDGLSKRMASLRRVIGPGGIEAEFEDDVEDVAQRARDLPEPQDLASPAEAEAEATRAAQSARNIPLELAKVDPAMAIVAAFIPVEEAVREYIGVRGMSIGPRSPIPAIRKDSRLPADLRAVLADMASVRNAAAHHRDLDLSYESAVAFIQSAETVAHQMRYLSARAGFGFEEDPRHPG